MAPGRAQEVADIAPGEGGGDSSWGGRTPRDIQDVLGMGSRMSWGGVLTPQDVLRGVCLEPPGHPAKRVAAGARPSETNYNF